MSNYPGNSSQSASQYPGQPYSQHQQPQQFYNQQQPVNQPVAPPPYSPFTSQPPINNQYQTSNSDYREYGAPQLPPRNQFTTPPSMPNLYYQPQPSYPQQAYQQLQPMYQQPQYQGSNGDVIPIPFSSPCNGRKKALMIGINYFGQKGKLNGCINDVRNMKQFLCSNYGFTDTRDSMVCLTDDQTDQFFIPTKINITNGMKWLVNGARPGDSLFFHFSGHGGQQTDKDGDEHDGTDETILPVDFKQSGQITDDELNAILVRDLPQGVRMLAIFDSCHSGTALDLPYQYLPDGRLKEVTIMSQVGSTFKDVKDSLLKQRGGGLTASLGAAFSGLSQLAAGNNKDAHLKTRSTKSSRADVISLSGCKDKQTSADTFVKGYGSTGAMSHALIKVLGQNLRPTYGQLLGQVRKVLRNEYSQIPQLSSAKPMQMNELFLL